MSCFSLLSEDLIISPSLHGLKQRLNISLVAWICGWTTAHSALYHLVGPQFTKVLFYHCSCKTTAGQAINGTYITFNEMTSLQALLSQKDVHSKSVFQAKKSLCQRNKEILVSGKPVQFVSCFTTHELFQTIAERPHHLATAGFKQKLNVSLVTWTCGWTWIWGCTGLLQTKISLFETKVLSEHPFEWAMLGEKLAH